MRTDRSAALRRRFLAAGLAAGVLAGAALGAGRLGHTVVSSADAVSPEVLHAAPAVVTAGARVVLPATAICSDPTLRPRARSRAPRQCPAVGRRRVDARRRPHPRGDDLVDVPGMLVPPEGFSYWLDIVTSAGAAVAYPPGR